MTLCHICKGIRKLCGRERCPILTRIYYQKLATPKIKESLFGPSPKSVFVGHENYPDVFVGPMVSLNESNLERVDTPEKMFGLSQEKILEDRYSLVRGKLQKNVFTRDRYIRELQAVTLSAKPVDLEINFRKKPSFSLSFSPILQPMGASGEVNKIKVVDNPKIRSPVYKLIDDDIKADEAVVEFYKLNFNVSQISKILSSGVLGIKKKLVPTKWSITAIDALLSKYFITKIKNFSSIDEYLLFENSYLGNHFYILLLPGNWEFEQFETWFPGTLWNLNSNSPQITVEFEFYFGRKDYASLQSGGYYASRFAVSEGLYKMKKQARAIVIREVGKEYDIPVGVWEVRENVRAALRKKPEKFSSLKQLLQNLKTKIKPEEYVKKSNLLRQKRIMDF
ncbi:MAG: hypothetical protein DRP10_03480 [Candidatus Aenigmatarchaeota archaeon]|nr:MAG: hypothetical protein DRP10_03480 [Candidatus Aenigmarchaeota archaeon]